MPLSYLGLNPNLRCKQIKKNGIRCGNPKAYGTAVCRYHGATPPESRKKFMGESNGNYSSGKYTQTAIRRRAEDSARIDALENIGIRCGLFKTRRRGRRAL